jgi:hypothetical protein
MKIVTFIGSLVLLAQGALAEDSYVCVPDKSVGFAYNPVTHQWDYSRFNMAGKKYVVTYGIAGWEWYEYGTLSPLALSCKSNSGGFINCDGQEDIRLNTSSLRYQIIYAIGYTANASPKHPEGSYAPRIEIGTCSVKPSSKNGEPVAGTRL